MKQPRIRKIGSVIWVHAQGQTFSFEQGAKQTRKGSVHEGANDKVLRAPMPGKILKVNKNVGEIVVKGETIIVMEAMKMEYALKAPLEGRVKELLKEIGDQVALGEKLGELE